jgi:hypothetical protein
MVVFDCMWNIQKILCYWTHTTGMTQLKINPLTPNDNYSGLTAPLTSKRCILYIYSTNICTEYFKHGIYSSFLFLQNAVCFIILTYFVPVIFTFYIESKLVHVTWDVRRINVTEHLTTLVAACGSHGGCSAKCTVPETSTEKFETILNNYVHLYECKPPVLSTARKPRLPF